MHKNHFWMVAMCVLPLLLIFLLPVFRISSPSAIFVIIIVMFLGHFLMMGRHAHHSVDNKENQNKNEENHESH